MIVLDTNVISELFRPHPNPKVIRWLSAIGDDLAITAITLAELLAGVERLPDGKRKSQLEAAIHGALAPFRSSSAILSFDDDAAVEYAKILARRDRAGLPMSLADAQIASICKSHDAICATRNVKDFQHTGVQLINPWD